MSVTQLLNQVTINLDLFISYDMEERGSPLWGCRGGDQRNMLPRGEISTPPAGPLPTDGHSQSLR